MKSCSALLVSLFLIANSHAFQRPSSRQHLASTHRFVSLSSASTASYATSSELSCSVNWDWKKVAADVFEDDERPIILFDGLCNLCHGGVNFAFDHDPNGNFRFASLQSVVGQSLLLQAGRNPQDISSMVLVRSDGRAFLESDAVLRIARGLDGNPLFKVAGTVGQLVPPAVRNAVLKQVSENRHVFGVADQCRVDFDGEFERRFVSEPKGMEGV